MLTVPALKVQQFAQEFFLLNLAAASRDTAALRVFPHATVGTLLQRIHDYFGLERFDIEVVVCRKGDRARRQLKKTVRLAKYEVEE